MTDRGLFFIFSTFKIMDEDTHYGKMFFVFDG